MVSKAASESIAASGADELTYARIDRALRVASDRGTGVSLGQLVDLLPHGAPSTAPALQSWLEERESPPSIENGIAYHPSGSRPEEGDVRRARGEQYLSAAARFASTELAPVRSWITTMGVTGSAAYGEPDDGDDIDFLTITRRGSVWAFLAYAYVRLRLRPPIGRAGDPSVWCFNYVMDEPTSVRSFAEPQGFLFAREALTLRPILGEDSYRVLLARASWLGDEAPRLYARWQPGQVRGDRPMESSPLAVRVVNALLFPVMATYLHLQALRRNRAHRRSGRDAECFQVETRFSRFQVLSVKYDQLERLMGPAAAPGVSTRVGGSPAR